MTTVALSPPDAVTATNIRAGACTLRTPWRLFAWRLGLSRGHAPAVEVWTHGGGLFELNSMYALPDDAWTYELTARSGHRGQGLAVLIPDVTSGDAPFTPSGAGMVRVLVEDGAWAWPVVMRLVRFVEASGDIVPDGRVVVSGDLDLSCNEWTFGARRFEVNSFWLDDPDCWFYELYELGQPSDRNDYLDVRVPNVNPDPNSGVFTPDDAGRVTLNVFGTWVLPWPVLTHFVAAVEASGDIVSRCHRIGHRSSPTTPNSSSTTASCRVKPTLYL
ncbi:MAG: hypothetical protein QOE61_4065 [Micromonosporaceae bacterium]|jgi:hypothetical protein|nr:hypothetical protein [Micromonosporaceae bacterium]